MALARNILTIVWLPFQALGAVISWTGNWFWHIFIASTPPFMAIWMMRHEALHHKEEDEPDDHHHAAARDWRLRHGPSPRP